MGMKRVGFKRVPGHGTDWSRQTGYRWEEGAHWGRVCSVTHAWRWHHSPLPSSQSLLPPLLPPSFSIQAATGRTHASSGTTVVLETGGSYLKQDFKSEKTHSMGLTLITTQTPLKRKPRPITPVLKTFQKFPITLGITLKSLPCPTKAVHPLTPASLPVHIFWSQLKCQS